MKILQVNKYFYPKGGADKYFLNLGQALSNSGEEVAYFSMNDDNNLKSSWSKYFVSNISFNPSNLKDKIKAPTRIIYSLEAKKKFKKLLIDFKPDIIHLHNIYHQISPSILTVARQFKIPVIIHLHDYKLICPNYQLFVNNQVCQDCLKRKYYHCLIKKCLKNSYLKSSLACLEMYLHHSLLNIYQKNINHLISPSEFLKNKFIEFAWPENKFSVVYNPFDSNLNSYKINYRKENYLLYFGRLSPEKGIDTLIKALKNTSIKLKIVGHGEQEKSLKKLAKDLSVSVDFMGYKEKDKLAEIILKSKAVIIPSIWWENMPLNMLEALSLGKVVIASKTGGIPEIIKDGINGFLFSPNNKEELLEKINKLDSINLDKMSQKAKLSVSHLTLDNNLNQIKKIYQSILNKY